MVSMTKKKIGEDIEYVLDGEIICTCDVDWTYAIVGITEDEKSILISSYHDQLSVAKAFVRFSKMPKVAYDCGDRIPLDHIEFVEIQEVA